MKTNSQVGDTPAWIFQSWFMFAIAVAANVAGIMQLKIDETTRLLFIALAFFSIQSTFTLSKTIRDNRFSRVDTSQWILQSWAGFICAQILSWYSIYVLNLEIQTKWLCFLALIFLVQSVFVLSKTIRDNQKASSAVEIDDNVQQ